MVDDWANDFLEKLIGDPNLDVLWTNRSSKHHATIVQLLPPCSFSN